LTFSGGGSIFHKTMGRDVEVEASKGSTLKKEAKSGSKKILY